MENGDRFRKINIMTLEGKVNIGNSAFHSF